MSRRRVSSALDVAARVSLLVLGACSSPSSDVSLVFPTVEARDRTEKFLFTAVEPFLPPPSDSERRRLLLQCGRLSVFPPMAAGGVSRDVTDLSPVSALRGANREGKDFPFTESWDLGLDRFTLTEEVNPWRAVLLHFEARGQARRSEPALAEIDEERTLLEGCACLRLRESGASGDAALDAEVEKACPWVEAPGKTTETVVMRSVAPPEFRLEPCGVTELTAPAGRQIALSPGVCLGVTECTAQNPESGCFGCATSRCDELADRKNVAVTVKIDPPVEGVSVVAPVILTGKAGRVTPELVIETCTPGQVIPVQVGLLGRAEPPIEFQVRCVRPVDFAETPTSEHDLGTDSGVNTVIGITTLPAVGALGQTPEEKAKVVVLMLGTDSPPTARLEVWGVPDGSRRMQRLAELSDIPGRALGVHGFLYVQPRDGSPGSIPLLAVATATPTTTTTPRMSRANRPFLQLFRPVTNASGVLELEVVSTMEGPCGRTACGGRRDDACEMPPCSGAAAADYTPVSQASFASADQDGDGYADLFFGSDRLFPLTVFWSRGETPQGDMQLPPTNLASRCQCQSVGRVLPFFAVGQVGGPGDPVGRSGVDFVMGDGTGAYVRYGAQVSLEGMPCSAESTCPDGAICADVGCGAPTSGGVTSRCLKPCSPADRMACGGRPNLCVASANGGVFYCGTEAIGCNSPSAVWKLVTVHDVGIGRVSGGSVGSVVAVGAGSPVPGFSGGGTVRVFFGGATDLTRLDMAQTADRLAASVDLTPRRLRKSTTDTTRSDEAQGPRAVRFGDFNRDGAEDLAVLYTTSEEIRLWLGSEARAPGEIGERTGDEATGGRIKLNTCEGPCMQRERCFPYQRFAVGDVDGDGAADVAAICSPESVKRPRLKLFSPEF